MREPNLRSGSLAQPGDNAGCRLRPVSSGDRSQQAAIFPERTNRNERAKVYERACCQERADVFERTGNWERRSLPAASQPSHGRAPCIWSEPLSQREPNSKSEKCAGAIYPGNMDETRPQTPASNETTEEGINTPGTPPGQLETEQLPQF